MKERVRELWESYRRDVVPVGAGQAQLCATVDVHP